MTLSNDARLFRQLTIVYISKIEVPQDWQTARLGIDVMAYPPDRRRRDLDNLLKPLLDALEHAKVYRDDSQIDSITIRREERREGGSLKVVLFDLPNPQLEL